MAEKSYSRRRKERMQEQENYIRMQILAHAQSLAEEMNLRMLLQRDIPQHVLFVESVTVTDIVFPETREGFLRSLGRSLMRLLYWLRTLLPI